MEKLKLTYLIAVLLIAFTLHSEESQKRQLTVSLLTCDAGRNIYELEGHEAMRFVSRDSFDITVNWGLFDFDTPNFVYRFTKGETDYKCGYSPTGMFVGSYVYDGRRVTEQVLNLTDDEAHRLLDMVMENLKPENATYRYNYVKDNCSTRPLAMIEKAVGDSVTLGQSQNFPADRAETFRTMMRRYHANYPWYQFGIDLALGSGIDYRLSEREKTFSPLALSEMLTGASIGTRPLVRETHVLANIPERASVAPPTPFWLTPMSVSLLILALTIMVSVRDVRRKRLTRWFDTVLYGLFGTASLVITFLIFVSVHEATSPNWLYLWLNPTTIIAAGLLWIKAARTLLYWWQIVNFAALIVLLTIGACEVQSLNIAFYPLIVSDLLRSITYIHTYRCRENRNS